MLETGYSRRSNNMTRKRIPRIVNTDTKTMTISIWNNVTFIEFHALVLPLVLRMKCLNVWKMNKHQYKADDYFVTDYQIRLNSSTV